MTDVQEKILDRFSGDIVADHSCFTMKCKDVPEAELEKLAARVFDWSDSHTIYDDVTSGAAVLHKRWLEEAIKIANERQSTVRLQLTSHAVINVVDWVNITVHPNGAVDVSDMSKTANTYCNSFTTTYRPVFSKEAVQL